MLNTTKTPSEAIFDIADTLRRRLIRYIDPDTGERKFLNYMQAGKLVDYFEAEKSANSVTYDAELSFPDHEPVLGTFTITREGHLFISGNH